MNTFSSFKPAWHIKKIEDLRKGKDVVPTHLQIILSDLCNQNCHFCAYRMDGGFSTAQFAENGNKNPPRFIPTEKAKEILDDCHALGVGAIEFTGGGEPTVHKDWVEILTYALDLGLQVGLVTNGVLLQKAPNDLIERLTWLRVSLDAGTAETYERIRESKQWSRVMNVLWKLGAFKKPLIGVGFVVTRENYRELYQAAMIVKEAAIPYIRVSAMFSDGGDLYYAGIKDEINAQRAMAAQLADKNFKVVDFFDDRIGDLRSAKPDYKFCGYQQFVLYIGGNQKVYTCCTNAYTPWGEIGDLKQQRFRDFLKKHRRYDFDARSCHHCQFNEKNRVINYLLDRNPSHVDFV